MVNEAVRRRAASIRDASKPLSLEYMGDRLDVDDPLYTELEKRRAMLSRAPAPSTSQTPCEVIELLLRGLRDALPVRYAYEALLVNEFKGVDALQITTSIGDNPTVRSQPIAGDEMLRCLGFDPDAKRRDLAMLAVWLGASLVVVGLLLRFYVREAR